MADQDLSRLRIDKSGTSSRPRRGKRRLVLLIAAAVVVIGCMLYFTGIFRPALTVDVSSVVKIFPSQTFTLLNASGYVVPQRKAAVGTKLTGKLVSISVEEGSRVKSGAIIARLENDDLEAQRQQAAANLAVSRANLDQAKAELKDAEAAFGREKRLLEKEFTTQAAYDAAEARFRKAVASVEAQTSSVKANGAFLKAAEVSLDYSLIRAPFDAVVLTKNADVGDIVTPIGAAANAKAAVVTIADMESLQVEADVSESNIEKVKVGQPCEIQLDALPETRLKGAIHMIVPTADRTKASIMVKVRFVDKDARVLPEMSAKVAFLSRDVKKEEETPRTAVSPKAIRERNGKKVAFVVRGSRVVERAVATGGSIGDMVEVASGLSAGERVVVNPPATLRNDSRVKVSEK
jgi:RND family efflux transporter MFP subunit